MQTAAMRHRSVYSQRAKLGVIVPPTNTVNEAEWARLMPAGVTFHTARMKLHADTESPSGRAALHRDLDLAIGSLVPARIDVIAYACTAGSMSLPIDALARRMSETSGRASVTTAAAIVQALRALAAQRIVVATPYHDALNAHEVGFLSSCGFEVLAIDGLGIGASGPQDYIRIAETPLEVIRAQARQVMRPRAEALLMSCTDYPALGLVEELERDFGIPVITSNTATLWAALRAAGIPDAIPGGGQLLH
jgi:maleate isomerase/arylmalonate decarboxylase